MRETSQIKLLKIHSSIPRKLLNYLNAGAETDCDFLTCLLLFTMSCTVENLADTERRIWDRILFSPLVSGRDEGALPIAVP